LTARRTPALPLAALFLVSCLASGCGAPGVHPAKDDPATLAAAIREGDGAGRAAVLDYMASPDFPRGLISESPAMLDAVGGLTVGADKALALQAVQLLARCPMSEGVCAILSGVASGADPVLAYHASKALERQPKR
jgi:hypothetical protein